ncbi:MAG: TetR family transcriptional regulator [Sporolactobacillus sp.]
MPKVSEAHFAQRRKQILQAAQIVFSNKGFEPATMQDIVNETGMSRGGVYQYFSSTEAMMRALLEENNTDFENFINSLIQKHTKMWDAVQDYLEALSHEAGTPFSIAVYEYFVTGWRNEERKTYLRNRYLKGQNIFSRIFQEGVRRGEFIPQQPIEDITRFFINTTDGIALEAALLGHKTVGAPTQIDALRLYLRAVLGIQ